VVRFAGGDFVFYAVISDEADSGLSDATIACVGWEAVKQWGGTDPGTSGGICRTHEIVTYAFVVLCESRRSLTSRHLSLNRCGAVRNAL
jgi:hypothetical protein